MPIKTNDPTAVTSKLSTDLADIIKGYSLMVDRADEDLQPVVQRLHALHKAHAAEVMTELESMGGHPENSGSMMGAVRVAVATAQDWFDTLDTSALPRIIGGEERLIHAYAEAIEATVNHPTLHEMLIDQRAAIDAQIEALQKGFGD
ncbi:MAG: PA2169 family four-helix-bundle protein [Rhodobacteraceae bacterium]|nr:PA2169 family four-helix-bundle protein [Paracoccaceae bacterium]MCF8516407.1 PA2169 family four-helix-bundle protein [Paracoccaceae bacterium]MCF8520757.1 PA2169 family four-helix-bundle protein [Paracoccaceae bacterium]